MNNTGEKKLWAVRLEDGRRFLNGNMIALSGADLGDLSRLEDSKEAFREAYEAARPQEEASVRTTRSTLCYRLVREIHDGDYAALVCGGEVWLGVVEGGYSWNPSAEGSEHRRTVRWEKRLPQDEFSRAALREVSSSPMPLFEVKGGGEQFLSAFNLPPLQTKRTAAASPAGAASAVPTASKAAVSKTAAAVSKSVKAASAGTEEKEIRSIWTEEPPDRSAEPEEPVPPRQGGWTAKPAAPTPLHPIPDDLVPRAIADPRRFLLEDWRRKLDADDLRAFAAGLLRAMEYDVALTEGRENVELTAVRDELTPPLLVMVRYGTLTHTDVEQLEKSLKTGECGVIFTLSDLSPEARERMKAFPWVRCVDGKELAGLVLKYYGKLDPAFQRQIPLRMGYVPAT